VLKQSGACLPPIACRCLPATHALLAPIAAGPKPMLGPSCAAAQMGGGGLPPLQAPVRWRTCWVGVLPAPSALRLERFAAAAVSSQWPWWGCELFSSLPACLPARLPSTAMRAHGPGICCFGAAHILWVAPCLLPEPPTHRRHCRVVTQWRAGWCGGGWGGPVTAAAQRGHLCAGGLLLLPGTCP
jgi:hypothetical protein